MKKVIFRVTILAILAACGWGGYKLFRQLPQRQQQVPTAKVRRDDVVIRSYSRGELRAVRSITLIAPNLFSTVQVTRLAPVGSLAREKDLIVEFDDSDRRASLEETLLEVEQIDEQIKKSEADLAIRNNQDQVDLLKTRYAVRRAELEVQRNELLSPIDAKKNLLNLEEQRRRLKQLESDIKSRQEQARAEIAVLREQRNKSMIDVGREKQRIAQAKVLSPMTGLVSVRQNRGQGFFFPGMQLPDIREGDTLQPGVPVADVLDLSELEVSAKIGELDRANLHEGQEALVQLDAIPEKKFHARIKSMSGTASANIFSGDPSKKFDVAFSIDMKELLAELGAKPETIRKIMDTAERNRKKGPPPSSPGMAVTVPGGAPARPASPAGGASIIQAANPQQAAPLTPPAGAQTPPAAPQTPPAGARSNAAPMAAPAGSPPAAPNAGNPPAAGTTGKPEVEGFVPAPGQFSDNDRAAAKLPLAPEDDSQLEVLIRPGLLADVEIIVEKIPKALHIPTQAVFEKDGKSMAWVQVGKRFEPRPIRIARRSESTVVIAEGLKPGDTIALGDPYASKSQSSGSRKGGGNPMGAVSGDSGRKGAK
jgi:HlyD family secretion protein